MFPQKKGILMVAWPQHYSVDEAVLTQQPLVDTRFLTMQSFTRQEKLCAPYEQTLWAVFHTRGLFLDVVRHADWCVCALQNELLMGSLLVCPVGHKWFVEYVMVDPAHQGHGFCTALLDRLMREAQRHGVHWVLLNCDAVKDGGKLPVIYQKFGFHEVVDPSAVQAL